jgi:hypothetical protein
MENVTEKSTNHVTNLTKTNLTNRTDKTNRLNTDMTVESSFSPEEGSQVGGLEGRRLRNAESEVGSRPSRRTETSRELDPEFKKGTDMSGQFSDKTGIHQGDQINLERLGGKETSNRKNSLMVS